MTLVANQESHLAPLGDEMSEALPFPPHLSGPNDDGVSKTLPQSRQNQARATKHGSESTINDTYGEGNLAEEEDSQISMIADTQFVEVEYDTQATNAFDDDFRRMQDDTVPNPEPSRHKRTSSQPQFITKQLPARSAIEFNPYRENRAVRPDTSRYARPSLKPLPTSRPPKDNDKVDDFVEQNTDNSEDNTAVPSNTEPDPLVDEPEHTVTTDDNGHEDSLETPNLSLDLEHSPNDGNEMSHTLLQPLEANSQPVVNYLTRGSGQHKFKNVSTDNRQIANDKPTANKQGSDTASAKLSAQTITRPPFPDVDWTAITSNDTLPQIDEHQKVSNALVTMIPEQLTRKPDSTASFASEVPQSESEQNSQGSDGVHIDGATGILHVTAAVSPEVVPRPSPEHDHPQQFQVNSPGSVSATDVCGSPSEAHGHKHAAIHRPLRAEDQRPSQQHRLRDAFRIRENILNRVSKEKPNRISRSQPLSGKQSSRADIRQPTPQDMMRLFGQMIQDQADELQGTKSKVQEQLVVIETLSGDNEALTEGLEELHQTNEQLLDKLKCLEKRSERYKLHINEVVMDQKALHEKQKSFNRAQSELIAELASERNQRTLAQEEIDKFKNLFSWDEKMKRTWQEARHELANQSKTIELLRKDLEKGLLDLQRERKLTDDLRKQQDNKAATLEELKPILIEHRESITNMAADHQEKIQQSMSVRDDNRQKIAECLTVVQSIKECGEGVPSKLDRLFELGTSLTASVESGFQSTHDMGNQIHEVTSGIIENLKQQLEAISVDQAAMERLNEQITTLRHDKAEIEAKVDICDTKVVEKEKQIESYKRECAEYQTELKAKTEELHEILSQPREDPAIHRELGILQARATELAKELNIAIQRKNKAEENLQLQMEKSQTNFEQIEQLRNQVQQEEIRNTALIADKKDLIQAAEAELKKLRVQMETDTAAKILTQDAKHRQLSATLHKAEQESKMKLDQAQQELLREREQVASNASTIMSLQSEIEDLRAHENSGDVEQLRSSLESIRNRCTDAEDQLQFSRDENVRMKKAIQERDKEVLEQSRSMNNIRKDLDDSIHKTSKSEQLHMSEIRSMKDKIASMEGHIEHVAALRKAIRIHLRRDGISIEDSELGPWAHAICQEVQQDETTPDSLAARDLNKGPANTTPENQDTIRIPQEKIHKSNASAPSSDRHVPRKQNTRQDRSLTQISESNQNSIRSDQGGMTMAESVDIPDSEAADSEPLDNASKKPARKVAKRQPARRTQSVTSSDALIVTRTEVTTEYSIHGSTTGEDTRTSNRFMSNTGRVATTPRLITRTERNLRDDIEVSPMTDLSSVIEFNNEHPEQDHARFLKRQRSIKEGENQNPEPKRAKQHIESRSTTGHGYNTRTDVRGSKKPTKGILKRGNAVTGSNNTDIMGHGGAGPQRSVPTIAATRSSDMSTDRRLKRPSDTSHRFDKPQYNRVVASKRAIDPTTADSGRKSTLERTYAQLTPDTEVAITSQPRRNSRRSMGPIETPQRSREPLSHVPVYIHSSQNVIPDSMVDPYP